jgi:archaellum component FlaC
MQNNIPTINGNITKINNDISYLDNNMTSVLHMLSGFVKTIVKDSIRYLDYQIDDIHHEISVVQ